MKEITERVIGVAIEVHKVVGPGLAVDQFQRAGSQERNQACCPKL